jgi:hypothetical protein
LTDLHHAALAGRVADHLGEVTITLEKRKYVNGCLLASVVPSLYLEDGNTDIAVALIAQGDVDALANGNGGELLPHQVVCDADQGLVRDERESWKSMHVICM